MPRVDGLYYRDVRQSQADEWRTTWREAGWRVTNEEPVSPHADDEHPDDPVLRCTLHATETAQLRPGVPAL